MGFKLLLLVFAAVTLGGLGTIWGALLGSLVIGLMVEVAPVITSVAGTRCRHRSRTSAHWSC